MLPRSIGLSKLPSPFSLTILIMLPSIVYYAHIILTCNIICEHVLAFLYSLLFTYILLRFTHYCCLQNK